MFLELHEVYGVSEMDRELLVVYLECHLSKVCRLNAAESPER